MNTVLFKSWHALAAAVVVAAFASWSVTAGGGDRAFQLGSGWASLALMLVVLAYVLRKYVHKLGISPEFRMRVPIERLENAESRLAELRSQMVGGALKDAEVLQRARAILKQERVHRVVKVRIEDGVAGERVLRAMPTGPLGSVARWMRAHLYYGVAAAFLVAMHGRFATHSGISITLNGLTLLTIASGLVGVFLWVTVPRLLTEAERELSIEKAHALRESLDRKIEAAYADLEPSARAIFRNVDNAGDDFPQRAAAALKAVAPAGDGEDAAAGDAARDLLALLGQRHGVRREWDSLMRVKRKMHVWRIVHIPAAVLLMAAVAVHVVSVLWY